MQTDIAQIITTWNANPDTLAQNAGGVAQGVHVSPAVPGSYYLYMLAANETDTYFKQFGGQSNVPAVVQLLRWADGDDYVIYEALQQDFNVQAAEAALQQDAMKDPTDKTTNKWEDMVPQPPPLGKLK